MKQPTVYLTIDNDSFLAFDERGEVLETNEVTAGKPDWTVAGIADARGGAGAEGFKALHDALTLAEKNAELLGLTVQRVTT